MESLIAAWVGPGLERNNHGYPMPGSREGGACKNISGLKAPSTAIPPRTIQRPFGAHSDLGASSCPHILKKTRPLRGSQKDSPPDTPSQAASRCARPHHPPSALLRSDTLNHPLQLFLLPRPQKRERRGREQPCPSTPPPSSLSSLHQGSKREHPPPSSCVLQLEAGTWFPPPPPGPKATLPMPPIPISVRCQQLEYTGQQNPSHALSQELVSLDHQFQNLRWPFQRAQ